jgi:hypothetical protein
MHIVEPVIHVNPAQRMEIFWRGQDLTAWHATQVVAAPDATWSAPSTLGGTLTGGLALGVNQDGRLQLFSPGPDGRVYHRWQAPAPDWSPVWLPLGTPTGLSRPAVVQDPNGALRVFACSPGGGMYTIAQQGPNGDFVQGEWASLDGAFLGDPVASVTADGSVEVFGLGLDNHLWVARQQEAASFGGWQAIPGGDPGFNGNPSVCPNGGPSGALHLVARGLDSSVYETDESETGWSDDWQSLGGTIVGEPRLARNAGGDLSVFCRGSDNAIWYRRQVARDVDDWTWEGGDWQSRGGIATSEPVVGTDAEGRLYLAYRGPAGQMCTRAQQEPGGEFLAEQRIPVTSV